MSVLCHVIYLLGMLNLFQHLICFDSKHITKETLKQVQGDVYFMMHNGYTIIFMQVFIYIKTQTKKPKS